MDAIISHGCFLRECSVQHSIVGVRSRLESDVELQVNLMHFVLFCNYSFFQVGREGGRGLHDDTRKFEFLVTGDCNLYHLKLV